MSLCNDDAKQNRTAKSGQYAWASIYTRSLGQWTRRTHEVELAFNRTIPLRASAPRYRIDDCEVLQPPHSTRRIDSLGTEMAMLPYGATSLRPLNSQPCRAPSRVPKYQFS